MHSVIDARINLVKHRAEKSLYVVQNVNTAVAVVFLLGDLIEESKCEIQKSMRQSMRRRMLVLEN